MKAFQALFILFILLASSCGTEESDSETNDNRAEEPEASVKDFSGEAVLAQLYNPTNLPSQAFTFANSKGMKITGEQGTKVEVRPNSFVDQNGNPYNGEVVFELKECMTNADMVLGNMTTTSNGQLLQTGGMVYLDAKSPEGDQLSLADSKSIGLSVPSEDKADDMQIYRGDCAENTVNWVDPEDIPAFEPPVPEMVEVEEEVREEDIRRHNIQYSVEGFEDPGDAPDVVHQTISRLAWAPGGFFITKDSSMMIAGNKVFLHKVDEVAMDVGARYSRKAVKGTNTFREDPENNYIFEVKQLGWANIDRLYNDPRTQEVELFTRVTDCENYDDLYISMIFDNQGMYLPGYQMKDNTFSFTHGDYEKPFLPVGESATILVTAYKDSIPYLSIHKFSVQESQDIALDLDETTKDGLKQRIESEL